MTVAMLFFLFPKLISTPAYRYVLISEIEKTEIWRYRIVSWFDSMTRLYPALNFAVVLRHRPVL
jgi:hypothetical protein